MGVVPGGRRGGWLLVGRSGPPLALYPPSGSSDVRYPVMERCKTPRTRAGLEKCFIGLEGVGVGSCLSTKCSTRTRAS